MINLCRIKLLFNLLKMRNSITSVSFDEATNHVQGRGIYSKIVWFYAFLGLWGISATYSSIIISLEKPHFSLEPSNSTETPEVRNIWEEIPESHENKIIEFDCNNSNYCTKEGQELCKIDKKFNNICHEW